MNSLAVFIATFGYVGFFPIAPGTAGSLAALPLYALTRWAGIPAVELVTIVAVFAIGIWAATGTERALARKDPGPVVIDEVLGMLITLAFLPLSAWGIVAGLPVVPLLRRDQAFPGGTPRASSRRLGIMADDAMAGVYAHLVLRLGVMMAPAWLAA